VDTMEQTQIVDTIHKKLIDFRGKRLKVKANLGRSRVIECEGQLTQVHPQLFIIEMEKKRNKITRQSYQYVDILTGMVELSQIDCDEPLFPELAYIR